MSDVSRAEIERIARLARVDLDDETLDTLLPQVRRILDYVSQLESVDPLEDAGGRPWLAREALPSPRDDAGEPPTLRGDLADLAPVFREGFFVVPRLKALDDE